MYKQNKNRLYIGIFINSFILNNTTSHGYCKKFCLTIIYKRPSRLKSEA